MKKIWFSIFTCGFLLSILIITITEYNDERNPVTPLLSVTVALTAAPAKDSGAAPTPSKQPTPSPGPADNSGSVLSYSELNKNTLASLPSGTIINVSKNKKDIVKIAFYYEKITKDLKLRMKGKSYKKDCTVPYEDLRYVRVLYYGFDNKTHIGELVVNRQIAKDVTAIFKDLYLSEYPIEKMVLIDDYDADDEASMADNNTSSFNFRRMTGSKNLSKHALGLAIDINPLYNPYVKINDSGTIVTPEKAYEYQDRKLDNPYYITKNDVCYKAFIKRGFTWGGSWKSIKDYQHFEKSLN